MLGGITTDNHILLPTLKPSEFFGAFWHEYGHPIGKALSFLQGQVLTPDEVMATAIPLSLPTRTKLMYDLMFHDKPKAGLNEALVPTAMKVLKVFTKGNFDFSKYILELDYPYGELVKRVQRDPNNVTVTTDELGELKGIASKEGRKTELSPIAVEAGCNKILANSISSLLTYKFERVDHDSSHAKAWTVVHRAYSQKGYIIPSEKDLT